MGPIVFGIDAVVFYIFYRLYKRSMNDAKCVENAKEYEINEELIDTVKNSENKAIDYVFIRGVVDASEKPIRSKFDESVDGVIQKMLLKEHKTRRVSGHWSDTTRIIRDIVNLVPFSIRSGISSCSIQIVNPLAAKAIIESLRTTHDKFEPTKDSWFSKSIDRLSGEVTKGYQESEFMLPIGTTLSGLGKLVLENGVLRLTKPDEAPFILTTMEKKAILDYVKTPASFYKVLTGIFGISGMIILAIVIKDYYRQWRETHEQDMTTRAIRDYRSRTRSRGDNDDDVFEADNTFCVICLTNPREVVLLDCGHICICADCVNELPNPRKCPICRGHISRIVPTYQS